MLARYPTINSDGKKAAYRKSQEMLLKASRYFEVPMTEVEIPFNGRRGEESRYLPTCVSRRQVEVRLHFW